MNILAFPQQKKVSIRVGQPSSTHEEERVGQGEEDM
jgi:hypothetical protein